MDEHLTAVTDYRAILDHSVSCHIHRTIIVFLKIVDWLFYNQSILAKIFGNIQ